jgi:hypothetical protein
MSRVIADGLSKKASEFFLDFTNFTDLPDPTVTLSGDVTGSATMTDLASVNIAVQVNDNSHNHAIANVTGLTTLEDKLSLIEAGATSNSTDAQLRERSSHTGTQSVATVTGLSDAATTTVNTIRAGTTKADVGLAAVRNVSSYAQAEVDQIITDEIDLGIFKRYDLDAIITTAELDLSVSNVFRVDASTSRTLFFSNARGVGRAMTALVYIEGDSPVTWPATILWSGGSPPVLEVNWTLIILTWVDGDCLGSSGASA